MNELWKKHIQPILDSWQSWHNFSWIWDPFYERYPQLDAEQQAKVDDALVISSFDTNHEDLAIKALSIAGMLQNNHLASPRLIEKMKNGLRDRVSSLDADIASTFHYIVAIRFFGVKEAVPSIQQLVFQLEDKKANGSIDDRPSPDSHTFRYMLEKYKSIIQYLLDCP